jgi:O-antigen biosynthesis protein
MELSIIIVNYNVKHFLEQCLQSVIKASMGLQVEVFVVDNNSVDGSIEMVRDKFPNLKLIANKSNLGFSKANNQAIKQAIGKYVLLLNPDTIVQEGTFKAVVNFMDADQGIGGLGVKMVDGKGQFLPESKRGLPTPAVAFYKIFGLATLFPNSKKYGQYHLTYLDKDKNHEIDVLSGAFMLMRKSVLDEVGLLDETFFMYGEDIDLSYRIQKGGFKNYYFADTSIIHYKGESTKKSSVNYVVVFYKAMAIFAEKHFAKSQASLFNFLINIAIYLRAGAAIIITLIKKLFIYVVDFSAFLLLMIFMVKLYEQYFKNPDGGYYDAKLLSIALPIYCIVWLGAIFMSGGYDSPIKIWRGIRGVLVGLMIILAAYSLLPETYRFSRAIILIGALSIAIYFICSRFILNYLGFKKYKLGIRQEKKIAIAGDFEEYERVKELINRSGLIPSFIGKINIAVESKSEVELGNLEQLIEIIKVHHIDEIIFCAKNISSQKIIAFMSELVGTDIEFKIAPEDSLSIIGSNSIHKAGELYMIDVNSIHKPENKRRKRIFDIMTAIIIMIIYPILLLRHKKNLQLIKEALLVLISAKTWVGYHKKHSEFDGLPRLKDCVFEVSDYFYTDKKDKLEEKQLNLLYSKDYKILNDYSVLKEAILK